MPRKGKPRKPGRSFEDVVTFTHPAAFPEWITRPRLDGCVEVRVTKIMTVRRDAARTVTTSYWTVVSWDELDKDVLVKETWREDFERDMAWIKGLSVALYDEFEARGFGRV